MIRWWRALAITIPERTLVIAILCLGLLARLVVAQLTDGFGPFADGGEAAATAASFARNGTLADPFGYPTGLTAHVSPIMPIIVGTVGRVFGVFTPASALVLLFLVLVCVLGSAAIAWAIARELGIPSYARSFALLVFCLAPSNMRMELTSFRVWEGALAAFVSAALLWAMLVVDRRRDMSLATTAGLGLGLGLLLLISPPLGIAGLINATLLTWRIVPVRRWLVVGATGAIAAGVVLAPWTIRNFETFQRFIPIRDNTGLELSFAYNDFTLQSRDPSFIFSKSQAKWHPRHNLAVAPKLFAAGGEANYSDLRGREAKAWIFSHPRRSFELTLDHLRNYYFPDPWIFLRSPVDGPQLREKLRAYSLWPISLLGLIAIGCAAFWFRDRFLYLVTIVTIPAMPYMFVNPVNRYSYLVYLPLVFAAAVGTIMLIHLKILPRLLGSYRAQAREAVMVD